MQKWHYYCRSVLGGGGVSKTTESGGGTLTTTEYDGASLETTSNGNGYTIDGSGAVVENGHLIAGGMILSGNVIRGMATMSGGGTYETTPNGLHNHGGAAGSHNHGNPENANISPTISNDGQHVHSVVIPPHEHDVYNHTHFIDHVHKVNIPPHLHNLILRDHAHEMNIPDHVHDIEFGIFEGPTATSLTVKVDGNIIPGLGLEADEIDITSYMTKDDSGKISRGAWHQVEIYPNDLARIEANILTQIFVNSRGGGNY